MLPRGYGFRHRLQSIRVTLTLWYATTLALILCVFGWVLYERVKLSTYQEIDLSIQAEAHQIEETLTAFWEATRSSDTVSEGNWQTARSVNLRGEIARGRFQTLVNEWARQTGYLRDPERLVRILSKNGRILAGSERFAALQLPVSDFTLERMKLSGALFTTVTSPSGPVRLYTKPVSDGRGMLFVIQSAMTFEEATGALGRLRWLLLWMVPTIVLLTSAIGWFLARMALRPVGRMIQQAQAIEEGSLEERLSVPHSRDEVEQLGRTLNQLLERLERSFRRLRQFSAAASHELRTPLTVMKAELELALRKPRDTQEYKRVLLTHLDAVDDLIHIVETLLTLARSEQDSAVEQRPIPLVQLANRLCERLQVLAEERDLRLNVHAAQTVWVRGEPRLLERLLGNLIENAMQYTPPGGSIAVQILPKHRFVQLIVSDTGRGIPKKELPYIFNRFFSRRPRDGARASTGLGLGICRWIAEAHRGTIRVNSEIGRGTTFIVSLPAIPAPEDVSAETEFQPQPVAKPALAS